MTELGDAWAMKFIMRKMPNYDHCMRQTPFYAFLYTLHFAAGHVEENLRRAKFLGILVPGPICPLVFNHMD